MEVVTALTIVQIVTALATLALTLINSEGSDNSESATKKDAEEVFKELKSRLSTFQAVLGEKQREETGRSRASQDLVNRIRDCTFDIEDAFDEFLFAVPYDFLTTKTCRTAHKIIHSRTYRNALEELSSCRGKIMSQKELNHPPENGGPLQEDSSGTCSSYFVEEDVFVDLKRRRERLANQLISTNVAERATVLVVGPGGSDKNDQISSGHIHEKLHRYLEDKREAFWDRKGDCPKELKSSSEKIIERCEGLPLVIAAAVIERILQLSFEDLPDNLRSCFLYLSLFPNGYPIKRGRLIRLWIAEGFVKGTQVHTSEEVAETYMNILIERNLVQAERGVEISRHITSLSSLQELSLVMVNNKTTMENMGNLKELKKLRLACLQNELGKKLCESIQKMKTLTTLDLSLKGSRLKADVKPVEAFEDLQCLMELEMVDYYKGKKLVFKAGKFKNLKILHIEEFPDLSELVVENYAMPKLEKLIIRRCNMLKSVPDLGAPDCKPLVEFLDYGMNVESSCDLQRGKKNNENFDEQEDLALLLDYDSEAESTE
ncbi:hypothetical protein FEM48_Zijuj01G0094800 [Ziziphus jujuba var. spinosa]|uniref:Uncharacterized protein n=1 Tax=Ziziphus jujuba var. spinosa TaxID=714518 RepID=A0A978W0G2_ZIZJJ|nr:hypothetical protein FEM48_Zijuj01G0094800 [Ziziphus jujuba var. spinosa]